MNQLIAFLLIVWLVFVALTAYMAWERIQKKRKRDRFTYFQRRWYG